MTGATSASPACASPPNTSPDVSAMLAAQLEDRITISIYRRALHKIAYSGKRDRNVDIAQSALRRIKEPK